MSVTFLPSVRTSLNLRFVQVAHVSRTRISLRLSRWATADVSGSSLATINEYLLLKMKAEVNSQLGRSLIAMKHKKPR
jgi:hypothetical protein